MPSPQPIDNKSAHHENYLKCIARFSNDLLNNFLTLQKSPIYEQTTTITTLARH